VGGWEKEGEEDRGRVEQGGEGDGEGGSQAGGGGVEKKKEEWVKRRGARGGKR